MRAKHSKNKTLFNMPIKQAALSVLLVVCFIAVSLPKVAFSASMENLYVNGVNILTEQSRTVQCGAGTATFDDATEVLTIENAEITHGVRSGGSFAGIVASSQSGLGFDGHLNLRIIGNNTITLSKAEAGAYGRVGVLCNSRLYDAIILDYAEGASLTINVVDNDETESVVGISATLGGLTIRDAVRGTLNINANVASISSTVIGVSAKKSLLLNNADVNMTGVSSGISMSTNDSTYRELALRGGSVLTMTPNSAEYYDLTGIKLDNGAFLNVDRSTLNISKNANGKAFGTGLDITRQSGSDNSNYVITNGGELNLNINGSGYGMYLTGCDAELNNTIFNIVSSETGNATGIEAYPDLTVFAPQKVTLNGCTTNISVAGTGVLIENEEYSGSFVVDGGTFSIESKTSNCIESNNIALNNTTAEFVAAGSAIKQYGNSGKIAMNSVAKLTASSGDVDEANTFDAEGSIAIDTLLEADIESETGSVFKAVKDIAIVGADQFSAHSIAVDKPCVEAGTSFSLTGSGTTSFLGDAGYGITVDEGDTTISNVDSFGVTGTIGLYQPNGQTTLSSITDIKVDSVINAIKNDTGNITLSNVSGFGLKSTGDVFVAEKGNIVFSGGQVNVANDSPDDRKGLGLLAKEGNIIFNEGSTINITGKDGAVRAEKGNIEIRDCTTVEDGVFGVNIASVRNEQDASSAGQKMKPALEATEGEITIINSKVFGHGTESEYVIKAQKDITTNLGGVLYAEGGDFGIFTYGYFNMKTIDDEARVASTVGGIVSYRYQQAEGDDPNGFNIAAGLIDYNQKRELNVKNTGWIQGQAGICSMTTVAEQGVESIDDHLTGNDKNAWIKSGEYYTLEYQLAGGQWPLSDPDDPTSERKNPNPDVYKVGDPDITLIAPERDGYTFLGWTGTGLLELTKEVTISPSSGDVGSRIFTAVWSTGSDQTLLYVSSSIDRGTVSNDGETPVATASAAVGSTASANPGYHFVNWTKKQFKSPLDPDDPDNPDNPDNPGAGDSVADSDPVSKAKEMLFGKFASKLTPFAEGDGATDDSDGDAGDTPGEGGGDSGDGDTPEEDPDEIKTDETEDVVVAETERLIPRRKAGEVWQATVFFANFEGNAYKVKFNANGGSGVMLDQDYVYGVEGKLPLTGFNKGEYIFMGWSTDMNATKAEFADGAQVINMTEDEDGVVTLYAVWALPYKGEPGNGGSGYGVVYGASGIGGGVLDASALLGMTLYDLMGKAMPPVGDPVGRVIYCVVLLLIVGCVVGIIIHRKRKANIKKGFNLK